MIKDVAFKEWEFKATGDKGGVHFALALSRMTGLPLVLYRSAHTELASPPDPKLTRKMICGVAVTDDIGRAYRPEGIYFPHEGIPEFVTTLRRRAARDPVSDQAMREGLIGLEERTISETRARQYDLLGPVNEAIVEACGQVIKRNKKYLKKVPQDLSLSVVHDQLGLYGQERPHFYAEALVRRTGAIGMAAMGKSGTGHHSFVQHADGSFEDIWGRRSSDRILKGYGEDFQTDFDAALYTLLGEGMEESMGHVEFEKRVMEAGKILDLRLAARAYAQAS